jgi:hypothetical protein
MKGRSSAPLDLAALRDALIAALGSSTLAIETPQLGRVEYRSVAELESAIAFLESQIGAAGGQPGTFVFQSNRGTGGGYCRG